MSCFVRCMPTPECGNGLIEFGEEYEKYELGAMWEDTKFGVKHAKDFGKVAVVGAPKWVEWGTKVGNKLTNAKLIEVTACVTRSASRGHADPPAQPADRQHGEPTRAPSARKCGNKGSPQAHPMASPTSNIRQHRSRCRYIS